MGTAFAGLPQKLAYETVLRDAMSADSFDPTGIYFGTRSGQLFGSRDEGRSWQKILDGLPSVVCIRTAFVASDEAAATAPQPAPSGSAREKFPSSSGKSRSRFQPVSRSKKRN